MSRYIIENFFPATESLFRFSAPRLYDLLLPRTNMLQQPCYNATLLPLCVFGMLACLQACCTVKHSVYWKAFVWYSCMLCSAAISHCKLYDFFPGGAATKSLWIAGDVGFTCACSLCLCLGAIGRGQCPKMQQALQQLSGLVGPAALVIAVLGNCAVRRPVPFLNEVLYVQPTLLAAYLLFVKEVMQPNLPTQQRRAINSSAWCFLITPSLVYANPLVISLATFNGVCYMDVTHLYFLGCNLAVFFLARYLRLQEAVGASKVPGKAS